MATEKELDKEAGLNSINHATEQLIILHEILAGDIPGTVGPVALASTCKAIVDSAMDSLNDGLKELGEPGVPD